MYHLRRRLEDEEVTALEVVSIRLASIPFKAIDYWFATERTREAFGEKLRTKLD
jgi:hypothetical protein